MCYLVDCCVDRVVKKSSKSKPLTEIAALADAVAMYNDFLSWKSSQTSPCGCSGLEKAAMKKGKCFVMDVHP